MQLPKFYEKRVKLHMAYNLHRRNQTQPMIEGTWFKQWGQKSLCNTPYTPIPATPFPHIGAMKMKAR